MWGPPPQGATVEIFGPNILFMKEWPQFHIWETELKNLSPAFLGQKLALGRADGGPYHSLRAVLEGSSVLRCSPLPLVPRTPSSLQPDSCQPIRPLQEMLAIMKSIYDMMGRHTYPLLREDAPLEHVERFFQVSTPPGYAGRAGGRRGSCFRHP